MAACIYKSLFEWESPPKGTFPFNGKLQKQYLKKQSYKKYTSLKKLRLVASNKPSFKKQPSKKQIQKNFFVHSINMLKLYLNELKQIAKMRGIKGYKRMTKERLISSVNE